MTELSVHDFETVRALAYEKFGLNLRPGKEDLITARLGKVLRHWNCDSVREFCCKVRGDGTGEALVSMIDALTTNHTSFFRESDHFRFLKQHIVPLVRERESTGIWSAACSSGEEPYSIAFSLFSELQPLDWGRVRIFATDISTRMLERCREATYPASQLDSMDIEDRRKFLLRGQNKWTGLYRVKPAVRAQIQFQRLNLIEPFGLDRRFTVIFCRNVMIYFDQPTQQRVVQRLRDCIEPGGYLLIGHAESLNGVRHDLEYVLPAVYRKRG